VTANDYTKALGHAVVAVWGGLPAPVQHDLFEAAVQRMGEETRDDLAVFLHHKHPRTSGAQRRS